ncbi:MAG: Hsp20/alpha crystallin family protein [Deltaproteobacteria bacterium]|nr:MAG: Hsp20/alpha crystallin family protein [Deltaproteobacteria bacterium]
MGDITEDALEKLLHFRGEIDRIFTTLFDASEGDSYPLQASVGDIDIYEGPNEVVVEIELPGMRKQDMELSVVGDVLVLEGKREPPGRKQGTEFIRMERRYGKFRRLIEIPAAGNTASIGAKYENGLLVVTIPKIVDRRGRRRRIPIE